MENAYGIEHLLDDTYFEPHHIGDLATMTPGSAAAIIATHFAAQA